MYAKEITISNFICLFFISVGVFAMILSVVQIYNKYQKEKNIKAIEKNIKAVECKQEDIKRAKALLKDKYRLDDSCFSCNDHPCFVFYTKDKKEEIGGAIFLDRPKKGYSTVSIEGGNMLIATDPIDTGKEKRE